ncbi:MarR family winged helix-turn-helix transcriptional regulator [Leifsonia sp. A12D58]|uniref:MarR family winged helix-turn-helix transcriptional regulator n=1 Tax=Leifsonia sp. A12D58 TaxID=3397674 RepID=UPI0039DFD215
MNQGAKGVELGTSLGYLLKQAHSVLHSAMDAALRPLGLTVSQYACLEILAQRPGLSGSELARAAFVSRQSMNVLLQTLERDGLVSRQEHPQGGRTLPVELTAAGRAKLQVASSAAQSVEEAMSSGLDGAEQAQLRRQLAACVSALEARGRTDAQ